MVKTILFDFDGTMVNSMDIIINIYNELAEKYNYKKVSSSDIGNLSEITILERCKLFGVPAYRIPFLVNEAKHRYDERISNIDIVSGIVDVLNTLKKSGFSLAIISSNSESAINSVLKKRDIRVFESVYSSKNIFGKHYTINAFMKKFKLKKEEVLYIGDEVRDVVSCKKCGVKVIAVTWGYDSVKLLMNEKADFIADKPSEIVRIVDSL